MKHRSWWLCFRAALPETLLVCFTEPFREGFGDSNFQEVSGLLYSSGQTVPMGSSSNSRRCTAWFLGELTEVLLAGPFSFHAFKAELQVSFFLKPWHCSLGRLP